MKTILAAAISATYCCLVFGALGLGLMVPRPVFAQVTGGTLSGRVTDPSNAVIPQAAVALKDLSTGIVRQSSTDTSGLYLVPNLLPGTYDVTGSASGFASKTISRITITVGSEQVLDIQLAVGGTTQEVTVSADAVQVQLTSSEVSATVNDTTVRQLPLNGRSWTDLALLQPGVVSMASIQGGRGIRGFGNMAAIAGSRPVQNNYRVDGISENDYSNAQPANVLGESLGVDAIQEFSVISGNYSAEYGRTAGGVINAITRSGTNQFHGDAYDFLRNSALDARNFFDGPKIPPFRQNEFGVAAGAPIINNRTFVFGNYEGLRSSKGFTDSDTMPSQDARNGILHNANGSATTITVNPAVKPYFALFPLPQTLLAPGNVGVFAFAGQQATTENFATGRVDQKFSDADSMAGSFQLDRSNYNQPDSFDSILTGSKTAREFISVQETHVFKPQLLNTARVGFNRSDFVTGTGFSAINPAAASTAPSLSAVTGFDAPLLQVSGLTYFGGGVNSTSVNPGAWNSYQAYDDASLQHGKHSIKFGFAFERMQYNYSQINQPGGWVYFGSLQNFLLDEPGFYEQNFAGANSPRDLRQSLFGGYVQDDFHLLPHLTLNLGLRYEMTTAPIDATNMLARLLHPTDATITTGNPYFSNPTLHNFEPRIGFAWDPFGTGKTSIRGGYGLFDVLPLTYQYSNMANNSAPYSIQRELLNPPAGAFPSTISALTANAPVNTLRVGYIQPNPPRNYVMQYNLSVQRQLAPSLLASVTYLGSRGFNNEFRVDDMNWVLPTLTSAGYLFPNPIGSGKPLNPNFGRIDRTVWDNPSSYNGLALLLQKQMSHGLQFQVSYTWAKSMDDGSAAYLSDPFSNSLYNTFWFDESLERSVSDFNIAQNLSVNYIWIPPTPHSLPSAAKPLLGGWEVGGIMTVQTGAPFTPIIGGTPLGGNEEEDDYPNRSKGSGCSTGVNPGNVQSYINLSCFSLPVPTPAIAAQCVPFGGTTPIPGTCQNLIGNAGRNSLVGPGLFNFNFSMLKNNYIEKISETFNVQFRMEAFNIFNHPNFNAPNSNNAVFQQTGAPQGGAGRITGTSTTSRQIQFGLKVIW